MSDEQESVIILRASETGRDLKPEVSAVFVDGFYQWLNYFSKDKAKLAEAFTHTIHLDKRELRRVLGLIFGSFAYIMLRKHLENHPYPFEMGQRTGSVEFVATAPEYRGQGVAAALIRHIMSVTPYDEYVLEVADTNTAAVRVYERLGFREFLRVKAPDSKRSGVNEFVYMKVLKEAE